MGAGVACRAPWVAEGAVGGRLGWAGLGCGGSWELPNPCARGGQANEGQQGGDHDNVSANRAGVRVVGEGECRLGTARWQDSCALPELS